MKNGITVKISGFRELDAALSQLPKATQKTVLRRTLIKAGEPIKERAQQLVPISTGDLRNSIVVSPRIKNKVGNAEFSAAIRSGLGKDAAVKAMRDARRANKGSFAEMYVGPRVPLGWYGHLVEFGTRNMTAKPFMRPAWDALQMQALDIIRKTLGGEIMRAAKRISKSKRSTQDVKTRASAAAIMASEVSD